MIAFDYGGKQAKLVDVSTPTKQKHLNKNRCAKCVTVFDQVTLLQTAYTY